MTSEQVMALVDAHVKASLSHFAGSPRDTAATRAAIALALAEMAAANVQLRIEPPSVPTVTPPKAKKPRIFGG